MTDRVDRSGNPAPPSFWSSRFTALGTPSESLRIERVIAVSRLFLDNVRHVQGSWVTQGPKIGQVSLSFGGDDLGSIMIEENVVYAAGARNKMSQSEMRRVIADAGYTPVQRRTLYDACKEACCTGPIPQPKVEQAGLPVVGADIDAGLASA